MTPPRPTRKPDAKKSLAISDARAMRALAHPLRVALLDLIQRDGELTATRAAELLGESPGNMSWHLQTLAKYGFVEEAGTGRGRSRPWRAVGSVVSFDTALPDTEGATAGEALERTYFERTVGQMGEWWSHRAMYSTTWRRASFMNDTVRYLTPQELTEVMDAIRAIYDRYPDRRDESADRAEALPVRLHAHGHPIPPTAAGN